MKLQLLRTLLTLWVGSLWTVCLIVAPALFAVLEDRHLAGDVAGFLFRFESWLGVIGGALALWLLSTAPGERKRAKSALIALTAAAPLANELLLRPFMDAARAAGETQQFAVLHGVGAVLFAIACVSGLALVWRASSSHA